MSTSSGFTRYDASLASRPPNPSPAANRRAHASVCDELVHHCTHALKCAHAHERAWHPLTLHRDAIKLRNFPVAVGILCFNTRPCLRHAHVSRPGSDCSLSSKQDQSRKHTFPIHGAVPCPDHCHCTSVSDFRITAQLLSTQRPSQPWNVHTHICHK